MFYVEDDLHAQIMEKFLSKEKAIEYLRLLKDIPWGVEPNVSMCINPDCERWYWLIEQDDKHNEISREEALLINSEKCQWLLDEQ